MPIIHTLLFLSEHKAMDGELSDGIARHTQAQELVAGAHPIGDELAIFLARPGEAILRMTKRGRHGKTPGVVVEARLSREYLLWVRETVDQLIREMDADVNQERWNG